MCTGNGRGAGQPDEVLESPTDLVVTCGRCNAQRHLQRNYSAFVCPECRCVNRIVGNIGEVVAEEEERSGVEIDPTGSINTGSSTATGPTLLRRIDSGVFQVLGVGRAPESRSGAPVPNISNCSVCLEGPGDTILTTCAHGGFCEPCARHIAGNAAVGGAHCPRCRRPIESVLRLSRVLSDTSAVAIRVNISMSDRNRAPPKVPPPPGYRKKQQNNPGTQ